MVVSVETLLITGWILSTPVIAANETYLHRVVLGSLGDSNPIASESIDEDALIWNATLELDKTDTNIVDVGESTTKPYFIDEYPAYFLNDSASSATKSMQNITAPKRPPSTTAGFVKKYLFPNSSAITTKYTEDTATSTMEKSRANPADTNTLINQSMTNLVASTVRQSMTNPTAPPTANMDQSTTNPSPSSPSIPSAGTSSIIPQRKSASQSFGLNQSSPTAVVRHFANENQSGSTTTGSVRSENLTGGNTDENGHVRFHTAATHGQSDSEEGVMKWWHWFVIGGAALGVAVITIWIILCCAKSDKTGGTPEKNRRWWKRRKPIAKSLRASPEFSYSRSSVPSHTASASNTDGYETVRVKFQGDKVEVRAGKEILG